jgi:hypothetical protein
MARAYHWFSGILFALARSQNVTAMFHRLAAVTRQYNPLNIIK